MKRLQATPRHMHCMCLVCGLRWITKRESAWLICGWCRAHWRGVIYREEANVPQ
jgi:hypothetical protein